MIDTPTTQGPPQPGERWRLPSGRVVRIERASPTGTVVLCRYVVRGEPSHARDAEVSLRADWAGWRNAGRV